MRFRIARGVLAALALCTSPVQAHPMPQSIVLLDFYEQGVAAELRLPIDRLEIGFGQPLLPEPGHTAVRLRPALATYIAQHVSALSLDGRPWCTQVRELTVGAEEPAHDLVAQVWLEPPAGAPVRRFTLQYDVIVHQLVTHIVLVSARRDWHSGILSGTPQTLGVVRYNGTSVPIDRPAGSAWRGVLSVVLLGMRHIAEGTDHQLFLLVLLLPAPLGVREGRWGAAAGIRQSTGRLLRIVTAFTIGHSLTLIVGAVGVLRAPSQPVEVLIAISIFISALHALWPLFPGREAYVAAGFGLVHGLAFASVVAEFGLDTWHTTLAIFGFNLGIELMQLVVVGVTVPWLLLLARTPVYTPVRLLGALASGAAALGWMAERGLMWMNPVGSWAEWAAAHAVWMVCGLAAVAIAATVWQNRQRPLAT